MAVAGASRATGGAPLSLAVGVAAALAVGVKLAGRLEAPATATGGVQLSAAGVAAALAVRAKLADRLEAPATRSPSLNPTAKAAATPAARES